MITLDQVDLSGMNFLLRGIQDALIGSGESGDARELVRQEARLLSWECSRQLSPRNQAAAKKKISRDLKSVFTALPANGFDGAQAGGEHGTRWLYAGPNYLVGVKLEDYQPEADLSTMEGIYNSQGRGRSSRGNRSISAGTRGRQKVTLINRVAVKKSRLNALLRKLSGRIGRLRATFAFTAHMLGQKKVPKWISRHFDSVAADGKAVFDDSALRDPLHPSIVFGSRAPGIENFEDKIAHAVQVREKKLAARLRLILNGYAKDHREGRHVRSHAHEHDEPEEGGGEE